MKPIIMDISKFDPSKSTLITIGLDESSYNDPLETLRKFSKNQSSFSSSNDQDKCQIKLTTNQKDKLLIYLKDEKNYRLNSYGDLSEADYVLAFSFGENIDVNLEISLIVEEILIQTKKHQIFVQWEIGDLLSLKNILYKRSINKINYDYDKDYIDTEEVVTKFLERIQTSSPKVLLVSQAWHAPRCKKVCEDRGIEVVGGKFVDEFSPNDNQKWVRNAFRWVLKEATK